MRARGSLAALLGAAPVRSPGAKPGVLQLVLLPPLRSAWWLDVLWSLGPRNAAPLNRSRCLRLPLDRGQESTGFRYTAERRGTQPPYSPGSLPAPSTTGIRTLSSWSAALARQQQRANSICVSLRSACWLVQDDRRKRRRQDAVSVTRATAPASGMLRTRKKRPKIQKSHVSLLQRV